MATFRRQTSDPIDEQVALLSVDPDVLLDESDPLNSGTFDILSCPREIRDQIYGVIFGSDVRYSQGFVYAKPSEKRWPRPVKGFRTRHLNILLVSRQISKEAIQVFYAKNVFRFYTANESKQEYRHDVVASPFINAKALDAMRRLEIYQQIWINDFTCIQWLAVWDERQIKTIDEYAKHDAGSKALKITFAYMNCGNYDWRCFNWMKRAVTTLRRLDTVLIGLEHGSETYSFDNGSWVQGSEDEENYLCTEISDIVCRPLRCRMEKYLGPSVLIEWEGRHRIEFHPCEWMEKSMISDVAR